MTYDVSHKTLIGANPLHIKFNKVDALIRDYDATKHLVLFSPEEYDAIFDWIRYLLGLKSKITYGDYHNYTNN